MLAVRERSHLDRRRSVRQIKIERKAAIPRDRDRYAVLPLDPRDPDVVRAKILERRGIAGTARTEPARTR
jgi:hypothetical protein